MANKGLRKWRFCASAQRTVYSRDMPPRVFSEKRLQAIENKGNEGKKEHKETTKRLQADANKRVGTFEGPESLDKSRRAAPHPGATQINVKRKGLREKQFVRV